MGCPKKEVVFLAQFLIGRCSTASLFLLSWIEPSNFDVSVEAEDRLSQPSAVLCKVQVQPGGLS